MPLKLGTSGVRGKYVDLTPEIAASLSQAFSTYVDGGSIALATDTRPSSIYLKHAAVSGLVATGAQVDDYAVLPTPILQWLIKQYDYSGGLSISGGHTSIDRNSLIFLNSEGGYLNPFELEEFFNLYHANVFSRKGFDRLGDCRPAFDRVESYFEAVSGRPTPDTKRLRFAIDCSHGAAGRVLELFARRLNLDVIRLFCGVEGASARVPEPNRANADILATVVRETRCDGGFLLNSDASRILMVDETGRIFSEELTLPLFTRIVLEREKTDIVTTYSTSKTVDRIAEAYGAKVFRTDVGPPSVVQAALEVKASIGGEGSGSIVFTPFSLGYDAFLFIATIVQYLRTNSTALSAISAELTEPDVYKATIPLPASEIYASLEKLEKLYPNKTKIKDGIYVEQGDAWLCIRASTTRPMIRVVGEGGFVPDEIERVKENLR
jgi:phosphomannomutase